MKTIRVASGWQHVGTWVPMLLAVNAQLWSITQVRPDAKRSAAGNDVARKLVAAAIRLPFPQHV